jgi:DNA-binding transcriptional ArsR family regulator
MSINTYNYDKVKSLGEIFKLLSEPNRLKILCNLGLECRPVSDIISATGLSQTNVSFHLRILREAGLVKPERKGAFIYYCLPDTGLLEHLENFSHWIEQLDNTDTNEVTTARAAKINTSGLGG